MASAVRIPIDPGARLPARRTLEGRFFVRWPGAWAALSRAGQALPPRSRLRSAMLRRSVLSGWGAWTRGDHDLMLIRYAPDCQVEPYRAMVGVGGMRTSYHGHAGFRELAADLREAWERMELIPQEIVDAGNPVVILGYVRLRARGSGIEFESPIGSVVWAKRGLVARERDFGNWDEALREAGIPATAVSGLRETPVAPPAARH